MTTGRACRCWSSARSASPAGWATPTPAAPNTAACCTPWPPAPGRSARPGLLKPGGTVVIDDLTPASAWPPRFEGHVDQARMHWLTHPALDAAELRLAPDLAALVATRRFPAS
jgi:hypothetical protein